MTHPLPTIFHAALASAGPRWVRKVRTERVQIDADLKSRVLAGSITGYELVDYVLGVAEGQALNVRMTTSNAANYFNILAPGEDHVAMFRGPSGDNHHTGIAPVSGDYTIRVYQMQRAARRNASANYRLEIIITAGKDPPSPRA